MSQIFLQGCIEGGDSILTFVKKITSTFKSSRLKQLLRKRKIKHVPITIINKDTPKKKVRSEINLWLWMYYQVCILDKHFQKNIILALHSLYQVNLTRPKPNEDQRWWSETSNGASPALGRSAHGWTSSTF